MSPAREVLLDTAAFLDSPEAERLSVERDEVRKIVERFLACAYDELGKAPRLLEGDDLVEILEQRLPGHFGAGDPLAAAVPDVLQAWLAFQELAVIVPHAFEQRRALADHAESFAMIVASGALAGRAPRARERPFVHRADKVGRNDPCPCGSGRKFKQCCAKL